MLWCKTDAGAKQSKMCFLQQFNCCSMRCTILVEATAHFYYLKSTPVKCRHLLLQWMHCTPVLASDAL